MNRRALLALLATAGCHGRGAGSGLVQGLFRVAQNSGSGNTSACDKAARELAHLSELSREAIATAPGKSPVLAVVELLFDRLGFVREVDDPALDFVLLPTVLQHRRGSCVGLGTLLLCLAESLRWSAAGVLMPGHFYVRVAEGAEHENVELLRRGERMPDAWYTQRFPIPGGAAREYARPLDQQEVLGVVEYDVGTDHRRAGRIDAARAAFARAVVAFPDFAEAHASLGAMQQLLGQLDQATDSYRAARAKNPHLPGVDQNLALLARERGFSP